MLDATATAIGVKFLTTTTTLFTENTLRREFLLERILTLPVSKSHQDLFLILVAGVTEEAASTFWMRDPWKLLVVTQLMSTIGAAEKICK